MTEQELGRYEGLWKYSGDTYGYCPPRYVTDRGIAISRQFDYDRIILHYSPPHTPYTDDTIPEDSEFTDYEGKTFEYLQETRGREAVFEAYLNTLRWVLDDMKILLDNTDRETVVITADHGEAFGESGVYRHPVGSLHPHIRRVPWSVTTANDSGTYEPSFVPEEDDDHAEQTVEESLEALGYL